MCERDFASSPRDWVSGLERITERKQHDIVVSVRKSVLSAKAQITPETLSLCGRTGASCCPSSLGQQNPVYVCKCEKETRGESHADVGENDKCG